MADSLWKGVVDLLAAGTWTNHGATPAVKQVTESERGSLLTIAYENQSQSACVIVLPESIDPDHKDGVLSKKYTFECAIFRFPASVGADQDQDKLAGLIKDIDAILRAAVVSGYDDNYQVEGVNLSNRKYARQQQDNRHLFAQTNIVVEDWVV
jgi:hypothetical protein